MCARVWEGGGGGVDIEQFGDFAVKYDEFLAIMIFYAPNFPEYVLTKTPDSTVFSAASFDFIGKVK